MRNCRKYINLHNYFSFAKTDNIPIYWPTAVKGLNKIHCTSLAISRIFHALTSFLEGTFSYLLYVIIKYFGAIF